MKLTEDTKKPLHIEVTPLIDVVFILLIFFMVSSTFINRDMLRVDLPSAQSGKSFKAGPKEFEIMVSSSGILQFMGETIPISALPQRFKQLAKKTKDPILVLKADALSHHGTVVEIYDQARLAGIRKVRIAVQHLKEQSLP